VIGGEVHNVRAEAAVVATELSQAAEAVGGIESNLLSNVFENSLRGGAEFSNKSWRDLIQFEENSPLFCRADAVTGLKDEAGCSHVLLGPNLKDSNGFERCNLCFNSKDASLVGNEHELCYCGSVTRGDAAVDRELLHRRFAHWNERTLHHMVKNGSIDMNIARSVFDKKVKCSACEASKATRHNPPTQREGPRVPMAPFERVWTDVKGKVAYDWYGNQYMVTFTCEETRWTAVYFCKLKSDVLEKFKEFTTWLEMHGWKIKRLMSDGGGEYAGNENSVMDSAFEAYCKSKGIEQNFTSAYTPAQNGMAERLNRTIIEHAQAFLYEAVLDKRFWSMAVQHVVWLRNRIYHGGLRDATGVACSPFEKLFKAKAKLSQVRVFGAETWRLDHTRSKGTLSSQKLFKGFSWASHRIEKVG
jgi:transposase InsO family protein